MQCYNTLVWFVWFSYFLSGWFQVHPQAAVDDYLNFLNEKQHVDLMLSKEARSIKIQEQEDKEFNTKILSILLDITKTLGRQGLPFRGATNESGNFYQIVQLVSSHNVPGVQNQLPL